MKVGFIGLGVMGRPMALHLLEAGHELSVYARRAEAAQPLVDAGAKACASPAGVAAASEVVFTMVTAGADVEQVALGEDGIVHGAKPGTVLVDMGTIPPGTARRVAAKLAAKGIETIDAPVSGGEAGARNATLAIMAGGKAEVLARVRPLLERLGKTIVHIGPSGAGQVAKACNQMIMVACIEAVAEALLLARQSGADPEKVRQALAGGSAGSRVLDVFGARMTAHDFKAGVEARLHHKDFGILMNEAATLGAPLPIAVQVWQQLNALMAQGWGREDTSALLRVLERESR
ncbi:MAG: 2-hydroxy-3-oxopropionate reductase [Rhodocyclaceae bacterium]|uniref:NAD(P)-dependent oxidoreductase n=1 Tax=Candidatus Desulfobacillus denitrificans TaxID=2608985 RepID=A0A809QXC5_9PROT|nr:NAD(P)-dependent oxidoreductase [Candidatus Desulfobacillus denitrificans]GIK46818.1 MAG: 2-hydroxy-3-oxopropionate reductase [Betaproteobacteria bacterium]GJQ56701.1 MAG: 2-hydroxy-3-oxopropionate reductase [Rhodocyclaceae bacterium]